MTAPASLPSISSSSLNSERTTIYTHCLSAVKYLVANGPICTRTQELNHWLTHLGAVLRISRAVPALEYLSSSSTILSTPQSVAPSPSMVPLSPSTTPIRQSTSSTATETSTGATQPSTASSIRAKRPRMASTHGTAPFSLGSSPIPIQSQQSPKEIITICDDEDASETRPVKRRRTDRSSLINPIPPRVTRSQSNQSLNSTNSTEPQRASSANARAGLNKISSKKSKKDEQSSKSSPVATVAGPNNVSVKSLGKRRTAAIDDEEIEGHATMMSSTSSPSATASHGQASNAAQPHDRCLFRASLPNAGASPERVSEKKLGKRHAVAVADDDDEGCATIRSSSSSTSYTQTFNASQPHDRSLSRASSPSTGAGPESVSEKKFGKRRAVDVDNDDDEGYTTMKSSSSLNTTRPHDRCFPRVSSPCARAGPENVSEKKLGKRRAVSVIDDHDETEDEGYPRKKPRTGESGLEKPGATAFDVDLEMRSHPTSSLSSFRLTLSSPSFDDVAGPSDYIPKKMVKTRSTPLRTYAEEMRRTVDKVLNMDVTAFEGHTEVPTHRTVSEADQNPFRLDPVLSAMSSRSEPLSAEEELLQTQQTYTSAWIQHQIDRRKQEEYYEVDFHKTYPRPSTFPIRNITEHLKRGKMPPPLPTLSADEDVDATLAALLPKRAAFKLNPEFKLKFPRANDENDRRKLCTWDRGRLLRKAVARSTLKKGGLNVICHTEECSGHAHLPGYKPGLFYQRLFLMTSLRSDRPPPPPFS